MTPAQFHPDWFSRGEKRVLELDLGAVAANVTLPVLLVRGARPGKRLVATAAVHGDEYEGVRAIFDVYHALDPAQISGDFLAVPVANPPAFWNGTRTSPLDGANLARVFPGSLDAGPSAAIAYHLAHSIIAHADFYIDLHSAGIRWLMPTMVGYDPNDPRSRDAALSFGARVIWGHPEIAPGRTISFAASRGIPWLYTEARGAGRIDPADLAVFVEGLWNLMRYLLIAPGPVHRTEVEVHLYGNGNTDEGLSSKERGFLVPKVQLLERVRAGQELGRLYGLDGQTIEVFAAPAAGVVAMIRQFPVVEPGEPLFLLADTLAELQSSQRVVSKEVV